MSNTNQTTESALEQHPQQDYISTLKFNLLLSGITLGAHVTLGITKASFSDKMDMANNLYFINEIKKNNLAFVMNTWGDIEMFRYKNMLAMTITLQCDKAITIPLHLVITFD